MASPCVVLELGEGGATDDNIVLRTALSLFAGYADLAIVPHDGAAPSHALASDLADLCARMLPGAVLPELVLISLDEIPDDALARVRLADGGDEAVEAVVLLASVAFRLWDPSSAAAASHAPEPVTSTEPHAAQAAPRTAITPANADDFLRARDAIIAQRDALTPIGSRPVVVVIAQVQSSWGAVDGICRALRRSSAVDVEVVAVESEHEQTELTTAEFVRRQGFTPRSVDWLQSRLANPATGLALALFYDPWDGLRPQAATATFVSEHGVRVAYVPYGNNVGAGDHITLAAYDLEMHRLAWRTYARSETQRDAYARYCAVGADAVRVLGLPKFDRVIDLVGGERRRAETDRPVVLWNPHFSVEPGGWSTFGRYLGSFLDYLRRHGDIVLLARPHFRLWRDADLAGGERADWMQRLVNAEKELPNLVLDRAADYLDSFAAADAFVSDASSLISEFVLTDKPLLYTHRADGAGLNEDSQYFFEEEVATSWPAIEQFLDRVRTSEDSFADRRRAIRDAHFDKCDGRAAERIADDLVTSLRTERARVTQGVQR